MAHHCLMCGKVIKETEWKDKDKEDDGVPQKAPSFCQRCLAKVRKESDQALKPSKPM